MKGAISVLLIAAVLFAFVGTALANEMSGKVIAVDAAKGTLTLQSGALEAGFDCEAGSILKGVKVGDQVTVQYTEKDGKKMATKVSPAPKASGY